jgi:hypothetical protein
MEELVPLLADTALEAAHMVLHPVVEEDTGDMATLADLAVKLLHNLAIADHGSDYGSGSECLSPELSLRVGYAALALHELTAPEGEPDHPSALLRECAELAGQLAVHCLQGEDEDGERSEGEDLEELEPQPTTSKVVRDAAVGESYASAGTTMAGWRHDSAASSMSQSLPKVVDDTEEEPEFILEEPED